MDCRDARHLLAAYAGGSLTADTWDAVRMHLQTCHGCRDALGRIDSLAAVAADLADAPVPANLSRQVLAAARDRQAAAARDRRTAVTGDWNPLHWWRTAPLSLRWATLTLLLIGLALGTTAARLALPASAPTPSADADPLEGHAIDYLAYAPEGSLAGTYLALLQDAGEDR